MHKEILESGLGVVFKITSNPPSDHPFAHYIGKRLRFKNIDVARRGTALRDFVFEVREVQNNYKGDPCVRAYALYDDFEDTFGSCLDLTELEFDVVDVS